MSENRPPHYSYIGWRTELLAKLALSRLSDLTVTEQPMGGKYDFSVMTRNGFSFVIEVKGFSSKEEKINNIENVSELRWRLETKVLNRAKEMYCPVVLFLLDADTEHGRYLRLDTLKVIASASPRQTIRVPIQNSLTNGGLRKMITELETGNSV